MTAFSTKLLFNLECPDIVSLQGILGIKQQPPCAGHHFVDGDLLPPGMFWNNAMSGYSSGQMNSTRPTTNAGSI